jgi:hypothetical protein
MVELARTGSLLRSEQGQRRLAWAGFAAASAISVGLIGYAGRGQTLKGDEWGYALHLATEPLLDAVFNPPAGKYLLVLPMLLYKAAFSTIGIADYLPYRLAGMALTVSAAALFLTLGARRIGYLAALPTAVLVLFLGSSGEVTATPLRIPAQIALVAGLGMLLLLERRDLRRDLGACALLLVSITSHPLGVAFAAAAAVLVLFRPAPERWRRAWVFVAPLLVFAAWYVALREPASDSLSLGEQLRDLPRFEAESLSAMAAAASGVFRSPISGDLDFLTPLSYLLAVATVVALGVRAFATRLPASFWAILAAVLVLFAAPAFAPGELRVPYAPRYLFPGVIMLLLLLSEALRGVSLKTTRALGGAVAALVAIFGFGISSNAIVLEKSAQTWGTRGEHVRAELAAVDLAGGEIDPTFRKEVLTHAAIWPATYLATSEYGSPAFNPSELRSQPGYVRRVADMTLARALNLHLTRIPSLPLRAGSRPSKVLTSGKVREPMPGCVTLLPSGAPATSQIQLPRWGVTLAAAPGSAVKLALARFGPTYSYALDPLRPHRVESLRIRPDPGRTPWRLLIRAARQDVTVCGIAATGAPAQRDR